MDSNPCMEADVYEQQIILAIVFPVIVICFTCFVSIAMWSNARRRERESFYRNEMMKKVTEGAGAGATTVLEMLREEERASRARRREGYKFGGLVAMATGAALMWFLHGVERHEPVFLVGLIPLFVGVAMLAYVYLIGGRD